MFIFYIILFISIILNIYTIYKFKTKNIAREYITNNISISFELEEITKTDLIKFQDNKEILEILLKMVKNKIIKGHELLRLTKDSLAYLQIQGALNSLHEFYNEIHYLLNPEL